jgi:glutamate-1-semialdehyde 2,1-aminomutase
MPTLLADDLTAQYTQRFARSQQLHREACQLFPDGVTHDIRRLKPFPVYVERAAGAHKWAVDGPRLIDYFCGHGSLLLGHSHPAVTAAVCEQAARMTLPGSCHQLEIDWARWVQRLIPSAERVRFTASGTEATLMAFRLARLHTGKPRILKFSGHFHGWHDAAAPGSGPAATATQAAAGVPGVPTAISEQTLVIPPNDPDLLEQTLARDDSIAAVVLEPTGGHWGAVPIRGPFLHTLRELTARHGVLLIFDEVITGFRVHPGGAQAHYQVRPDLTTLAKILAGGLPGGCVAGRADLLGQIETRPGQPKVYHPGTFNGNPLSAAAGVAALREVATGQPCERANRIAALLRRELNRAFIARGLDWLAYGEFSMFYLLPNYHGPRPEPGDDSFIPYDGDPQRLDAPRDPERLHRFRQALLLAGVDMPGYGGWLSAAHDEADVAQTVEAVCSAAAALAEQG